MNVWYLIRVVLALVSPALFIYGVIFANSLFTPAAEWRVNSVEAVPLGQATPPAADANWQSHSLPLSIRDAGLGNSLWYRIALADIDFAAHGTSTGNRQTSWSLSVGAPFGAVALYHNNKLIREAGRSSSPQSVFRWPIAFEFTAEQLNRGGYLHVNFQRPNDTGWVYYNYLAPHSELTTYLSSQNFLRTQLPRWIQLIMFTVSIIMLLLYWFRRTDKQYAWWALMLFTWALRETSEVASDPWLADPQAWIALGDISMGVFVWCTYQFIKCHAEARRTVFDLAINVSGVLWGSILIYLTYTDALTRELSTLFWTPWIVMVALICCGILIYQTLRHRERETGWLLAVCWFVTAIGIWDYRAPIDPYSVAGYIQYVPYSAGLALTAFTVILMNRFAKALRIAETTNAELAQQVAAQREELQETYALAHSAEKKQLVHEERERIMRDVHDGIGGQLVQALSMVHQDTQLAPIESTLRHALDDLRLIIDSLAVPEGNLPVLLASMRHRLSQPIERAGLKFDWELQDLPDSNHLSQSDLLHLLRILQESVTNVLKHAEASRLRIGTDINTRNQIRIRVADDGCGIGSNPEHAEGRGLPGMRKRAAAVGIEITIGQNSQGSGTQVELLLPAASNTPKRTEGDPTE